MRILFVNHTFPGDLGPLLAAFAAQPGHEILFASCRGRRDFSVPGVRHVVLSPSRSRRLAGDGAGLFQTGLPFPLVSISLPFAG